MVGKSTLGGGDGFGVSCFGGCEMGFVGKGFRGPDMGLAKACLPSEVERGGDRRKWNSGESRRKREAI
ncbi:hypothetical protein O6P43_019296 [Quillaja saponaria]|uniref:Uncharacterized protein n=1 Tax=Quillaja saponaria TaxID=32244 RepID=A0AAD7PKU6_QUISA|nr:hypothetical protein O6P43_019296 [Quillaja saponaria]